jgi:hypothetical protein
MRHNLWRVGLGAFVVLSQACDTTKPKPRPPNAPDQLRAESGRSGEIEITWQDNSTDETRIELQSRRQDQTSFTDFPALGPNAIQFLHTGLKARDIHVYRVRACNDDGCSEYSPETQATVLAPAAPSDLVATAGSQTVDLQWKDNSDDEANFTLEFRKEPSTTFSLVTSKGPNIVSHSHTDLTGPSTHSYRVFACNEAGCSEPSNIATVTVLGPPAELVVTSGDSQSAVANTTVPSEIRLTVRDEGGNALPRVTVTFSVVSGGGSVASSSAVTAADGTLAAPAWRLGKSAVTQTLRASAGSIQKDIGATVSTDYDIVIRGFGPAMSDANRALFTNAAARLRGIITGDVIAVQATNFDLDACGVSGGGRITEVIDDVVIYASIRSIDGPGRILAQAAPCGFRSEQFHFLPAIGFMEFDAADLDALASQGSLQDVIMHEMLHVLGIGGFWDVRGYLSGEGTPDPRYTGPEAKQGCVNVGGPVTCGSTVPVENVGGAGTVGVHWRESVFDKELMTGFADAGGMPLSLITIGGLADLNYVVNTAAFDAFTVPGGSLRRESGIAHREQWERVAPHTVFVFEADGRTRMIRKVDGSSP